MFIIWAFQNQVIFQARSLSKDYRFSFPYAFDEHTVKAEDNTELNYIYFKVPQPKGIILYFHGNRGSLKRWGEIAGRFTTYGYDVLVMDYRGYGKNRGDFDPIKMESDARLFYNLGKQFFSEDSIIVYGRSLGSHFATLVASENKPQRLILETPFTSITDIFWDKLPMFPVKKLIHIEFDNVSLIKKVTSPITVFHGFGDRVVSYQIGKKLFDAATIHAKVLVSIPGGRHNNLSEFELYNKTLKEIL